MARPLQHSSKLVSVRGCIDGLCGCIESSSFYIVFAFLVCLRVVPIRGSTVPTYICMATCSECYKTVLGLKKYRHAVVTACTKPPSPSTLV